MLLKRTISFAKHLLKKILGMENTSVPSDPLIGSYIFSEMTQILDGQELVIVDVGGAVSLQPHFHKLIGNSKFYIFEPDERSYTDLINTVKRYSFPGDFNYVNKALAGTNGKRTLYLSNVPTGTSILKLEEDSPFYSKDSSYLFPMREEIIDTVTIETSMKELEVKFFDAIKLDVQGAELEILKGIDDKRFEELNSVELEIGLHSIYVNQTTFCDVVAFMKAKGFGLFELRVNRANIPNNVDNTSYHKIFFNTHEQSPSIASRVWEFDAIFIREPFWIASNKISKQRTLRIIALYCMYNFFTEAMQVAKQSFEDKILSNTEFAKLRDAIIGANKVEQEILKDVERNLKQNNFKTWAQYMWVPYPSN